MMLTTYKEIHQNDSVEKLLELMTDEAYYISCDARDAGFNDAIHNDSLTRYFKSEVMHHKLRVAWLYDTILKRLKGEDGDEQDVETVSE